MRRLSPHSPLFTLLLGATATLASFATDMGLPVLGEMAAELGVAPGRAALSLSVFMAGFALGPLAGGPLSDQVGRRPVLLAGCAMFAGFGGLGALASSFGVLLGWRFLMGAGAGACSVLVVAVVRDLFAGAEARVKQSYVNMASGVAPVVAPTLGVAVAALGGWRAIYAALAAGGLALLAAAALGLGESRPPRGGAPGIPSGAPLGTSPGTSLGVPLGVARAALAGYARVLRHPVTVGYALVVALSFGCLFAYIAGSSLVLVGVLGVSRRAYGLLFACTSAGLIVGALVSARLGRRGVPPARLVAGGLAAVLGSALALCALSLAGVLSAALLVPLAVAGFVGQGVVRPNAVAGALEPMAERAGVASAVLSGLQMVAGASSSALVAALFDGRSALAMTGVMALCASGSAAVYAGVVRPAERRRTVPAGGLGARQERSAA